MVLWALAHCPPKGWLPFSSGPICRRMMVMVMLMLLVLVVVVVLLVAGGRALGNQSGDIQHRHRAGP